MAGTDIALISLQFVLTIPISIRLCLQSHYSGWKLASSFFPSYNPIFPMSSLASGLFIFNFYLALHARSFGSEPECNTSVKFSWLSWFILVSWVSPFGKTHIFCLCKAYPVLTELFSYCTFHIQSTAVLFLSLQHTSFLASSLCSSTHCGDRNAHPATPMKRVWIILICDTLSSFGGYNGY